MKKILSLITIAAFLYSCQKEFDPAPTDNNNENSENLYELKINVANFGIETTNLSTSNYNVSNSVVAANKYLKYIFYSVYDSLGNVVNQIEQYKGDNNFGFISDRLQKGNYTIFLAGCSENPYWRIFSSTAEKLSTLKIYQDTSSNDIFYKKLSIRIVDKDTALSQVQLNRLSGKLEIHFTDSVPKNISYITTQISGLPNAFNVLSESIDNSYVNSMYQYYYYSDNYQNLRAFCLGSNNKLKVEIQAYNSNYQKAIDKVIDNIYIYPNKVTILTGKFNDTSKANIPIVVDPDLGDTINVKF